MANPSFCRPRWPAGLAKAGCARDARVIVEKPFGRDLASAQALDATLHEVFLMLMSVGLYAVFLAIQTLRHRHFFLTPEEVVETRDRTAMDLRPAAYHGALLLLYIVPIVLLSKKIAEPKILQLDKLIRETSGAAVRT